MILSDYVRKLNELLKLQDSLTVAEVTDLLSPVLFQINNSAIGSGFKKKANANFDIAKDAIQSTVSLLEDTMEWYRDEIATREPELYNNSFQLFYNEMIWDTPDHILNRRVNFNEETLKILNGRIQKYAAWKHAGMILRPGLEDHVDELVSLDPLYLVDEKYEMFKHAKSKFNDVYQSRLRYCLVDDRNNDVPDLLNQVPDAQIGYCLAYNYFHYKPVEVIGRYLSEIYKKLKPGGTFAFTYNDCDRYGGVVLAENSYCCYTPGTAIFELAEDVGFSITKDMELTQATSWCELQKPGTLTSIKGGQSLVAVKRKKTS